MVLRPHYPFRLHLRKLSDGRSHPTVAQSIIPIEMTPANPLECLFNIQLQETSVGVLIKQQATMLNEHDYLAVWNWQTGDLELVSLGVDVLISRIKYSFFSFFL